MPEIRLTLAADAAASRRRVDDNGFLHVDDCPVTRVQVAPYYGSEIPGWESLGLDPKAEYRLYRPADEIEQAAPTIEGLPIELMHHDTDAARLPKEQIIGSTGTDARFDGVYLRNSLHFTDAAAIARITAQDPAKRLTELSLSYFYDPDMTPGDYKGEPYDGVMRHIRGNHLALVDQGRAGPSVAVADRNPNPQRSGNMGMMDKLRGRPRTARDDDPRAERQEVESAEAIKEEADLILSLHTQDPATGEIVDVSEDEDKNAAVVRLVDGLKAEAGLSDEQAQKLADRLRDLAYSPATGDAETKDGTAGDEDKGDGARNAEDAEGEDDPRDALATEAEKRAFDLGVQYGERAPAADTPAAKAADRRSRRAARPALTATDAALSRLQGIMDAVSEVRPLVGEIRVDVARDSARGVYGRALGLLGVDTTGMDPASYRDVYRIAAEARLSGAGMVYPARDASPSKFDGPFANLRNIKIH